MSAEWMGGYASDVAYIIEYYEELSPTWLNYVCAINGVQCVDFSRKLRYCELGCGRGFGTILLAAANPTIEFVGIDYNPTHIAEARSLAAQANLTNVKFYDYSFGEAATAADTALEPFDFVTLHGVYTWVGSDARKEIHQFLRAKVAPGGVVYVSYNTLPGWMPNFPVQKLLLETSARVPGNSFAKIKAGWILLEKLIRANGALITAMPELKNFFSDHEKSDPAYLVHEYLHQEWRPMWVSDVIGELAEDKLTYIGSANIGENRLDFSVPPNMAAEVKEAPDVQMRELLKDLAVNKYFRRDVYVKGPVNPPAAIRRAQFQQLVFAASTGEDRLGEKWPIPAGGHVNAEQVMIDLIWSRLGEGPATGGEIMDLCEPHGFNAATVAAVLEALVHNSKIVPARPDFSTIDCAPAKRLNSVVLELSAKSNIHRYLAAPVTGSAVRADQSSRRALGILSRSPDATVDEITKELVDQARAGAGRDAADIEQRLHKAVKEFMVIRPVWERIGAVI